MKKTKLYILLLILLVLSFSNLRASIEEDPEQFYQELREKSGLEKVMTEVDLAIYYFTCCLDSVIKYSRILDQYGNRFDDRLLDAYRYRIKGYIADDQLKFDSALYFFNKSFDFFREEEDTLQMGWVTSSIGKTYFSIGNYELASDKYMQALSYFQSLENKEGIAFTLNGLGNACYYVKKYEMALEYYESSLEVYDELGVDSYKNKIYNNLASIQYSNENYSKALDYFFLAAEGYEKEKDYRSLSTVLNNISLCYHDMDDIQKAKEYVQRSLDYAIQEDDIPRIINAKLNFGYYLSSEGNFKEAGSQFKEGMDLSKEYGLRPLEEQLYVEYAEMYALSGDFEQAYQHRLKYDSMYFETISQHTQERIDELNLSYKTKLKEN
jgi:tetratricopeptide (TPR) repeat protein